MAPFNKSLCDLTRRFHSSPQLLRKHRAGSEVSPNARREIRTTTQALVRAAAKGVRTKFLLPEALGARSALGNRVIPAIDIEENMLFGAQTARSSAVDMGHAIPYRHNSIVGRNHLLA